ncbi:hypothetical protein AB0I28_34975 [Phytomonospora sp. NPDC050363]|uniref:hypothetical protein n=1 Tax=Phytomonospora sp. NPDC050363 TaxID=3155642 RepID=UPI0033DFD394
MSEFTPQTAQPERKVTPGTVNTAAYIQFAILALALLGLIFSMMYAKDSTDAALEELKRQQAPQDVIDSMDSSSSFTTIGGIIGLLLAAAYAVLGVFNRRGVNGTRIATWVLSGIFLLCGAAMFALTGLGSGTVNGVDYDKVNEAAADAVPSFYNLFSSLSGILQIVGYLAVIILLALPASNEFFRKAPPQLVLPGDEIK